MPLCVYCDASYNPGDRACASCGASAQLDSAYPVITGELVLVTPTGVQSLHHLPRGLTVLER